MNIYVGNLSHDAKEDDLRKAFESFGQVDSARIIADRFSGESRGFGFVEMPAAKEANAAIEAMNGNDFMGRELKVSEAAGKKPSTRGRGGFGRGRGGSGGGPGGRRGRSSRGPSSGGGFRDRRF